MPDDLIPAPRTRTAGDGGHFTLTPATTLDAGPGTEETARWLRAELGAATGLPLEPAGSGAGPGGLVRLRTEADVTAELGPEGYRLDVTPDGVQISGGGTAGVFWGAQTLRQLLGPHAFRRSRTDPGRAWRVAAQHIEDAPRFGWRGLMLDVSRHFLPKDGVLRYLDLLAAHKLNVLHFHLTDDQGWRIEIERYPELTGTGAWRPRTKRGHRASELWDERPHGGYYTQDDIREIVAYAAERHITVVPEIEMPGHSQAAIAAYPELGNTDAVDTSALGVWDTWGVNPNVLAPTDYTLRFYEAVLEEVLALFPSPFVHLGGDECPKEQWRASETAQRRMREEGLRDEDELQSWFLRHFARWLAARGRRLIGWDEILEGGSADAPDSVAESLSGDLGPDSGGALTRTGLPQGAAISSWRGYAGGIAAAEAGHDVVMCPEQQVYLDHRQDGGADEPVPIGFVRTLSDVYHFEPVPPQLAGTERAARVLGTQANMWSEVTEDRQRVDYQLFPRLVALAEVAWSPLPPPRDRDFAGFEERMLRTHLARLDAMGVGYRPPSGPRPWQRRPGVVGRPIEGQPPIV
ncbi:beta-N-acetylhexosaminidase [Streptomyces sp. N2-109]|uniref:beta-N-acetylhexosaminidase n=1 Tax=Streptomyces gossypii TaxID=2883101 RepID=A0ABT2JTS6_9ACTN|nr:beta-N-acetylhexosaminidase [Streptomyces gossypii]MCT2591278.1 beta-N-acetylhexosaminidase [Streptomyces gossypii]